MDTNSGEPWSEMDVWELKKSVQYGRSFAEVAGFLYRDESEVRQMADALGLERVVVSGKSCERYPTEGD